MYLDTIELDNEHYAYFVTVDTVFEAVDHICVEFTDVSLDQNILS